MDYIPETYPIFERPALLSIAPVSGDLLGASQDRCGEWWAHQVITVGTAGISMEFVPVSAATAGAILSYWDGNPHGFTMSELSTAVSADTAVRSA